MIGNGSNKDFALNGHVAWQTLQYRSIVMLKVNITDPTLPTCAKPNLKIKMVKAS